MHRTLFIAAALTGLSTAALAQETARVATQPAPALNVAATAPSTEALAALKILEDRGSTLKDFSAKLRYEVEHVRTATTEINRGQAAYVKDPSGIARVAILLDDLIVNGAIAKTKVDHRFVFDGTWMIEKDPDKKIYREIQLVSDKVKANAFKLRGPLPMPIGQKVADVLADFVVSAEVADKKDPPNTVHLKLIPNREGVYTFKQLDLWLDTTPDVQLPIKMVQTNLDDNTTTITLKDIKINAGAPAENPIFNVDAPPPGTGWRTERHPIEERPPATAPTTATAPAP